MDSELIELGKRITEMRKRKKMTQKELGIKLNVEHNTVSAYEKGKSSPSVKGLKKMASIFGCTVDELLGVEREGLIESDWKHLVNELKGKDYSPYKVSKILELHEQIQKLI